MILRKSSALIIAFLFLVAPLSAAQLKRVLVLDFTNTSGSENYSYLTGSITDAVQTQLKKIYAFESTPKRKWQEIAEANFLLEPDYYTTSVAMNIGLQTKQDVVIAGRFTVSSGSNQTVKTNIIIIDVASKKVVSDFNVSGPADNRIFESVDALAKKISVEIKPLLPSKGEWKKTGYQIANASFIEDFQIGARLGGGFYSSGWSQQFEVQQPSMAVITRANLPYVPNISSQFEFLYLRHTLTSAGDTPLNVQGDTNNFFTSLYFSYNLKLSPKFGLHPKVGFGYTFQSTTVTADDVNESFNNSFPHFGIGTDLSYRLTRSVDGILNLQSIMEIEGDVTTFAQHMSLGVNYWL